MAKLRQSIVFVEFIIYAAIIVAVTAHAIDTAKEWL